MDKIVMEKTLIELVIYYVIATAEDSNDLRTLTDCFNILNAEKDYIKTASKTLFKVEPEDHIINKLYEKLKELNKEDYEQNLDNVMLKLNYYNNVSKGFPLMSLASDKEVEELAYEIIYFNKGIDELQNESKENIYAMYELGERYHYAELYSNAYKLSEQAASLGHLKAKYNKAWYLYCGKGVEQNYEQAFIEINELISVGGSLNAYELLGEMYYYGRGVEQNYNEAFKHFSDICDYNYDAQYYLAQMYLNGYGVEKNKKLADEYMLKLAKAKYKKAIDYLLQSNSSKAEIKEINLNALFENSNEIENKPKTEIDLEFEKYSNLFKEKFGRFPYILEPSGTIEDAIIAIKECLEKNEDILDEIYQRKMTESNDVLY